MNWKPILTLAAGLFATAAAHAATTWEAYVYNPVATQPAVAASMRFIEEVKQKTNGELLINLHLGGSLPIKADGITAAVGDSIVQFGDDGVPGRSCRGRRQRGGSGAGGQQMAAGADDSGGTTGGGWFEDASGTAARGGSGGEPEISLSERRADDPGRCLD